MSDNIIKPNHNKIGKKHTYEVVTDIAEANPSFDEFDTVMLAYMFKHIPRAGRKLYPGKNELESKILDLKKTQEYLNAWINGLEHEIDMEVDVRTGMGRNLHPNTITRGLDNEKEK